MMRYMGIHRHIYVIYLINSFIRFLLDMSVLVYYLLRIWPHVALPSLFPYSWLPGGLVP